MGGRAVECSGLENRRGLIPSVGSNPTPSVTELRKVSYATLFFFLLPMASFIQNRHASDNQETVNRSVTALLYTGPTKTRNRCIVIPTHSESDGAALRLFLPGVCLRQNPPLRIKRRFAPRLQRLHPGIILLFAQFSQQVETFFEIEGYRPSIFGHL